MKSDDRPQRSPKVNGIPGTPHWYGYYAGYSASFVQDALHSFALDEGSTVLDPWNGAGTTTDVAASMGFGAIGFDLNPVLVIVARARLLDASVTESLPALTEEILEGISTPSTIAAPDPLETWISPSSSAVIRHLERNLQRVLVDHSAYHPLTDVDNLNRLSSLAALFYVALFEMLRTQLRRFRPTNPAWLKIPDSPSARVRPSVRTIDVAFRAAVEALSVRLTAKHTRVTRGAGSVVHANATALPLNDASVDAVLTSPPYCTRIDYIVTTLAELAVLGYWPRGENVRALRRQMLGTPTMAGTDSRATLPSKVEDLLEVIKSHRSIASATYYYRYFHQYFSQLLVSLYELSRVVRGGGRCGIVVQDSYYKDVHVDLPEALTQMALVAGWTMRDRHDFAVSRTKAAMNPRARTYRQRFDATESLLILEH